MSTDEPSPSGIRIKAALVVLGIFVAGAAAGAGLSRWVAPRPGHHMRQLFMGGTFRELGLSAEQEARAREINERHRPELEAILHNTFPKVRAIHEQMEKELRATLTTEQQKKLDEIKSRRRPPPGAEGMGPPPGGEGRHGWGPPPPDFFPPPPPPSPPENPPK